jgi:hypothetical protein
MHGYRSNDACRRTSACRPRASRGFLAQLVGIVEGSFIRARLAAWRRAETFPDNPLNYGLGRLFLHP